MGKKQYQYFPKKFKMLEVEKLSKLLVVYYYITIVIDVSFLLLIHRYCSISIAINR